jgi:predicted ATPase
VSPLLEREDQLGSLASAAAEGGRLVFVGGEAGVGKTALVRAFEAQIERRVLRGSCENLGTPTPLGPFVDIASDSGGKLATILEEASDPRTVARAVLGGYLAS